MSINEKAVKWALTKVGYKYSQPNRLKEDYFDCSSLCARAYQAVDSPFTCKNAPIPTSNYEVYDDQFELMWPSTYAEIGKTFGGKAEIALAKEPGALQFIHTSSTSRENQITHITMVVDDKTIVHARGTKFGVVTNDINLYAGKICAVVRYNPDASLRKGMCGDRVRELQKMLNSKGANLTIDGNYGTSTEEAVRQYGIGAISNSKEKNTKEISCKVGVCTGSTVNIRQAPNISATILGKIKKNDKILFYKSSENWYSVAAFYNGNFITGYMSAKYIREE